MAALSFVKANFGPAPPPGPAQPVAGALDEVFAGLSGYIRSCFEGAKDNRRNLGVEDRMMAAMRSLRGEYDSATLRDIVAFGGSQIYARVTASKVRGCAALLREIYTASDRPWALSPTPEPMLSGESLAEAVRAVLEAEVAEMVAAGQQPTAAQIKDRNAVLKDELLQMRLKASKTALTVRESVIDDVLWEGGFYEALWAFLGDIATFPFAVIKGPTVRFKNVLVWKGNIPTVERRAVPTYSRCSPFDVYFAPWSQDLQDGFIIHRERTNRASVQSMKGLPNYNTEAIDRVLAHWGSYNTNWYDYNETERADLEQRESDISSAYAPNGTERPLPMLSFYGSVSTQMLIDWGMDPSKVNVNAADISVFAYMIGNEVIGVTLNPHPTGRLPFYVDSFERVPGSCYGNAIPDLLEDVQGVGNAALRALVNNLAIASGPMGWINEDRLAENDPNADKLWPWKIFRFQDSMTAGQSEEPMKFFQPEANVEQLFMVYERMLNMADELSTIPRFMQGNSQGMGGAGRTASGLAMLMEASNRTIKQTISSIDNNVIESVVEDLNVYLALTRPDVVMEGDISVIARGAAELMQRETLRMRRIEFLNATNNPTDAQIVGPEGRFHLLKEVAKDLGLPTSDVMPTSEGAMKMIQQQLMNQALQASAGGGPTGNQTPPPGGEPPNSQQGVARPQETSPGA